MHKLNVFIINLSFSVSLQAYRSIFHGVSAMPKRREPMLISSWSAAAVTGVVVAGLFLFLVHPNRAYAELASICFYAITFHAVETRIVTSSHSLSALCISYAIYQRSINKIYANTSAYCFGWAKEYKEKDTYAILYIIVVVLKCFDLCYIHCHDSRLMR